MTPTSLVKLDQTEIVSDVQSDQWILDQPWSQHKKKISMLSKKNTQYGHTVKHMPVPTTRNKQIQFPMIERLTNKYTAGKA